MATIQLKRSNTAGANPTTSNLALGEMGINTKDGKFFLRKHVDGNTSGDSILTYAPQGINAFGTQTYEVKVVTKTAAHPQNGTGSSSGYTIDGLESPFLLLVPGNTYKFDQADASNSGHPLRFYLEEDNVDTLSIEFKNKENSKKTDYNKFFKLPLLDYEYQEMVIPTTDYDSEFTLPSKKIADMLSQLSNFGDDLNIKCSEDCVDFKASGNSVEMRVNIPTDDMDSYSIIEDEEVNLTYSLIYLSKMCLTNKLSNDIEFSLSN